MDNKYDTFASVIEYNVISSTVLETHKLSLNYGSQKP